MPITEPNWTAIRDQILLDPTILQLNFGSYGPTPVPVFDYVTDLRRRLASAPMTFINRELPELLWNARARLAGFVGVSPRRLIFTSNVTASINLVAASLTPTAPGEILMSDREYTAMEWCWERAARRLGLTIRKFKLPLLPKSADEIVQAVAAAITPKTRILFFSHVLSATGMVLPAKALSALARSQSITSVVDGAHGPGQLPVNIDDIGCDFYGANCHKWLLAPINSGFLAVGKGNEDRIKPLQVSWGYRPDCFSDARDDSGSTARIRLIEHEGTRDPCPWLAVPIAIEFFDAIGWPAVHDRLRSLALCCKKHLDGRAGLQLTTPASPELSGSMSSFWWPGVHDVDAVWQQFWERRCEVVLFDWPDGVMLRVAPHCFTSELEIERLARIVDEPGIRLIPERRRTSG